ncbi:hypothetical protein PGT21_018377 [Puccinia graminis f. sp. tritici]|uniref:Uncharacterized protein n=1 Tax=Puccinia graminis f. sp. tritici TaxID=56615 RepID=A0A5B0QFN6_PUCGR|nr:hypothetical protein PGT21_018377 [Puccinia graminis f. sp. tritici]
MNELDGGRYDQEDGVQKVTSLPTGVSPKFSYSNPENFTTTDQLLSVPSHDLDLLSEQLYPNEEELFQHTPHKFNEELLHKLWTSLV